MAKKRPIKQLREKVAPKEPNKFELLHSRKKFNVIGKKSKGESRSRVQARSNATDKVSRYVYVSSTALEQQYADLHAWKLCMKAR